ncbi:MAG: peptidylprolyl isomerase [Myxococcota bacterium]|nr:peptidylprolyl isomerase [Myxococcota bacterium]
MGLFSRKPKDLKVIAPRETAEHIEVVFTTSMGPFSAVLHHRKVPKTAQNFIDLCESGFYDGLLFHRVIEGFMLQTGCPNGDGRGDAGYAFADEFAWGLKHDGPGVLSMANSGPHTNGSQFFVTLGPTPHLNRKHSVFGRVTDGLDVVLQIGQVRTNVSDRPEEDVVMERVEVVRR